MADGQATKNRITLKIGVVYDKNQLITETKKAQATVDKTVASEARNRTKEIDKQTMAMNKLNDGIKRQKSVVGELTTGWNKTIAGFLKFSAISSIFMAVTIGIRRTVETIVALDTAMTNFNIVTKASQEEMKYVNDRAGELANTLGRLKTEIIDATTEFARAGFSINDSMLLAENGIKAANAGGVELADIVTYVIAGLKSFKLEAAESSKILDVLFSVANMTAIDLEGIGEAFLRSANTLQTAGASLEESAALIAAANETIQDPAKVGTALKTIASRLRGVGDEGEVIPTLAKDFKQIGIEIQNADGSFRDIYSIFSDFAGVYKSLDDLTRQSLIEKIAGKRQANILIGLVENFDLADKSLQTALESAGEVDEANKKVVASLQGQINILTNSFKSFFSVISNSEALGTLIGFLAKLVDGLTFLIKNLDLVMLSFGTLFTGLSVWAAGFAGLGASIGLVTALANPLVAVIGLAVAAIGGYSVITNRAKKSTDELADSTEKLTEKQRENQQVVESGNIKAQKKLADELQKQIDIIDELVRSYDDLSKSAPDDSMFGSNLGIQEFATDLNVANQAITEAEKQLAEMGYTVEEARNYIKDLDLTTKGFTQTQYDMAEANFTVKQLIAGTSDEYQILSDALQQLEIDGYLTDDMLNTLIETYPDLVSETGLQIDAVRQYLLVDREARNQILNNTKKNMEDKIKEAENEVKLYDIRLKTFKSFMTGMGYDSGFASSASANASIDLANARKVLQDAKNNISLLDNETKQLNATDKKRVAAIKESREETEKEEKSLTSLERELKRINQEIAINQQLQSQTEDKDKQIKLNQELISLYKLQKSTLQQSRLELEANNKSIKVGDKGYDDYIDKLYEFSLAIEQAETSTINTTYAIRDLKKEMSTSKLEAIKSKLIDIIKKNNDLAEGYAEDEVKRAKKAIDDAETKNDLAQESLDILKEEYEFNKKLNELNESISQNELESALLSTDNSLESQRRRAELAEELIELNKEKTDEINQYDFTLKERALEAEFKLTKENLEKELKLAEDTLEEITTAGEVAIDKITNAGIESIGELEMLLKQFTSEGSLDGLGTAWDAILLKLQEYITLLSSVNLTAQTQTPASGGISSNQQTYLENLAKTGTAGQKIWAESQLEQAKPQTPAQESSSSNQQKYLENLIKTGTSGQAAWAKSQLGMTTASKTPTPTATTSSNAKIGTAINIENMNNNIGSSYDAQKLGADLTKGSKNVLSSYGYTLTDR